MQWGHYKEGYRNHVVLALVINGDGLPFYWEVLPGSTADVTTVTWLIKRLSRCFDLVQTTLAFDRGTVSDDNLVALEAKQIKYILAFLFFDGCSVCYVYWVVNLGCITPDEN